VQHDARLEHRERLQETVEHVRLEMPLRSFCRRGMLVHDAAHHALPNSLCQAVLRAFAEPWSKNWNEVQTLTAEVGSGSKSPSGKTGAH
jgi:hypothetical protein